MQGPSGILGTDARTLRTVWTIFVFALAIAFLYAIRSAVVTFALAIFLALLLSPLVALVDRYTPAKVPRGAALGLVYVALLGLGIAVLVPVGSAIADDARALATRLPSAIQEDPLGKIPLPASLEPARERIAAALRSRLDELAQDAIPLLGKAAGGLVNGLTALVGAVLIPILAFFFIKDGPAIRNHIVRAAPHHQQVVVSGILHDLRDLLSQYLRAVVILAATTFLVFSIFLGFTGAPYAVLLAGIAGLLEFIPAAGPLIAAATIIGVCAFSGYTQWLLLLSFLMIYRIALDYGLQPALMAKGVELHPLLVVFAALAGGEIAGVPGVFFAVPVTVALRVIVERLARRNPATH